MGKSACCDSLRAGFESSGPIEKDRYTGFNSKEIQFYKKKKIKKTCTAEAHRKWYSSGKQPRNSTGRGQGMDNVYLEIFDLRPQPSHPKYVFKCFTKKSICFITNVTISKMSKNCQKDKASYPNFWCFPCCLKEKQCIFQRLCLWIIT